MRLPVTAATKVVLQVQKQLGHSSPTTTANMYADVPFQAMGEAVDRLYDATSA